MYSSLDMSMFLNLEATFSSLSKRKSTKVLHKLYLTLVCGTKDSMITQVGNMISK